MIRCVSIATVPMRKAVWIPKRIEGISDEIRRDGHDMGRNISS